MFYVDRVCDVFDLMFILVLDVLFDRRFRCVIGRGKVEFSYWIVGMSDESLLEG